MCNEVVPGDWQTDQYGKRFRMVGKVKEYEMTITVAGGIQIPESQLAEYNERMARQKKEQIETEKEEVQRRSAIKPKKCPFKAFQNSSNSTCNSLDCAMYDEEGCTMSYLCNGHTHGKKCPLCRDCNENCAWYNEKFSFPKILG